MEIGNLEQFELMMTISHGAATCLGQRQKMTLEAERVYWAIYEFISHTPIHTRVRLLPPRLHPHIFNLRWYIIEVKGGIGMGIQQAVGR